MKRLLVFIALGLACSGAFGQEAAAPPTDAAETPSLFSLSLAPTVSIPVGTDLFTIGGGGTLSADLPIPFLPLAFGEAALGYTYLPINVTLVPNGLSLLDLGVGGGVRLDLSSQLRLRVLGRAGYYYGILGGDRPGQGGGFFASAGLDASFELFPSFRLGAGAQYSFYDSLYTGISAQIGASYAFGGGEGSGGTPVVQQQAPAAKPAPLKAGTPAPVGKAPELSNFTFFPIFPAFYQVYSRKPLGRATLSNGAASPISDVKVSFLVKQYMDNPKTALVATSIGAGETQTVDILALFKKDMLGITSATTVSANITLEYTLGGQAQKKEYTQEVRVENRNAMTWTDDSGAEDDARAAAFVATTDPTVLKFSKNLSGMVKGKVADVLNPWLLDAVAVHEALTQYGISYVVDPKTPHQAMREQKGAVDFLQFPQETLQYKAGDCDDLSILYSSLLEAIGAETAFITIPGHIYMAVSLGMAPEDARKAFSRSDDLIFDGTKTWLPIEITQRQGGFLQAWADGAKEWRENKARGLALLVPVHDAWSSYESVGYASDVAAITMPTDTQVVKAYTTSVESFVNSQIATQEATLLAEINKSADPTKPTNRLGVLYARNGLFDKAEVQFNKLAAKEYAPALINLGNIYYSWRKDSAKALAFYQRAQKKDPTSAGAWLGVARVNNDQENYGAARTAFDQVKKLSPDLATQFGYLDLRGDESARAADISGAKSVQVWEDSQ